MLSALLQSIGGNGLLGSVAQVAAVASTLILALILVALGTIAYKHFKGGGIEWPDEQGESDDGEVARGGSDDEWDYY
jgi:hypothetical protein